MGTTLLAETGAQSGNSMAADPMGVPPPVWISRDVAQVPMGCVFGGYDVRGGDYAVFCAGDVCGRVLSGCFFRL
jgi:hypothetical protein